MTDRRRSPCRTQIDGGGLRCSAPTLTGRWPDAASFAVLGSWSPPWPSWPAPARLVPRSHRQPRPHRPPVLRPRRRPRAREVSPSASAARGAQLRDRSGRPERLSSRPASTCRSSCPRSSRSSSRTSPGRSARTSSANLISTTPRLLAGDNPPDLIRLPTMVSLVKDNLLKNLDDYATAFGWDKWPGCPARPESCWHGRDPRRRFPVRRGAQLQPDRRLLQQGAGDADRHDRAAEDGRRVRGLPCQGEGGQASADHAVERCRQRCRTGIPASAAHGRLRRNSAHQRLDLPEVRGHDRHADQPHRRPASAAVDRGGLLPKGCERHRVHRRERPVRQGRGRVHVQWRLAERRV